MAGKQKTHKGVQKRVRVTGSGKVKHKKSGTSHLMSVHNGKFSRTKRKPKIAPTFVENMLKNMLRGH